MENKEFKYAGKTLNGIGMLIVSLLGILGGVGVFVWGCVAVEDNTFLGVSLIALGLIIFILGIISCCGLMLVEPGQARVLLFFGKYRGTFTEPGYYWINPFMTAKKLSLRVRNLDAEPIKVNDKTGNPIMIGLVLVWRLKDTYKAIFDIDTQTMAEGQGGQNVVTSAAQIMNTLGRFVSIQADAALRQVAGEYAYDVEDNNSSEITLRDGSDEINKVLEDRIDERLAMAGIEVVEARINYLAYAPEIAAVMLRRQQASAIISAREKIVEGAVSMVKMALQKLSEENVVELDEEKKAAMVSNLLVVLCGDDSAQPVVNAGTLNH